MKLESLTVQKVVTTSLCLLVLGAVQVSAKDKEDSKSGRAGNWKSNAQGSPEVAACRKKVEADPKNAEAQNDLGWALRQNGDAKGAELALRTSISLNDKLAYSHSNLSVVLLDKGASGEALQEAKAAIALDPKKPIYHVVCGNAMLATGDAKGAIVEYKTAIAEQNDYENAYFHLAQALSKDGQTVEAKVALSQAMQLDPEDTRAVKLFDEIAK
ncbi:MAG: tetratricopeptide repeat protein [Candidatus Obscuribacterales bacterium]|nr:tetratricopeptide repeat protein [Candidatus Obscuribacterales bacterium]